MFVILFPRTSSCITLINTKQMAQLNKTAATILNSASSFLSTNGKMTTARTSTQQVRPVPKFSSSGQKSALKNCAQVSPKEEKKMMSKPRLFARRMNEIQKMEMRPIVKKPISYSDLKGKCYFYFTYEGLCGQNSLDRRKSIVESTT